ncbi:L-lactate MFS transporter [Vacuolonema iberomarrocanum]|uniref:L-lactate MFS transporter n=1 Tax=Vacuolonema iberomarrocanum TaxID=3454632 RepID=UPI0019F83713|nr:OFA family MFS transporter [filamentous cyanobacterium LEGE 07170]
MNDTQVRGTASDATKILGLPAEQGRWLLIPLGITVLLCLGTVYSWSIFRTPLEELLGISATESLLPFTTLLVVFAVLMPITGFYIDRFGARVVTAVGGVIMGLGYILSSFAGNITTLVLTYGVMAGIGVGIAYGVPLAVVARWFPERKGLAVGLTVVGFGLSPLITAPIARNLIASRGVMPTFITLGMAFTLIILVISLTMKMPPAQWQPAGQEPPHADSTGSSESTPLFQSRSFYGLWFCYVIGTFVGLASIGIASPVAQEIINLDPNTAALSVSLFAIFNGLGRPFFGWFTDRFNARTAAIASYVLIIIGSIMMLNASAGQTASYLIAFCLFTFALGGWLAIAPTATLMLFPAKDYAKNYGIVFTAFGVGALLGTLLAGRLRDLVGSYTAFFYPTMALAAVGVVLAIFMLKKNSATSLSQEFNS